MNEYGEAVPNVLRVEFDSADTARLEGKFVYQITIKDISGSVESFYGNMLIHNNIINAFSG